MRQRRGRTAVFHGVRAALAERSIRVAVGIAVVVIVIVVAVAAANGEVVARRQHAGVV